MNDFRKIGVILDEDDVVSWAFYNTVIKEYLKKWFRKVENKTTERVSIIHNNVSLDHFIISNKNYL